MSSLMDLERDRNKAFDKFQELRAMLHAPENLDEFASLAQSANDAWLELKQKEIAFNNQVVIKQMGDLYGC